MRRGFTLLEMLIVIGVFSVFGVVLALFMRAGIVNYRNAQEVSVLDAEAAQLLDMIRSDLVSAAPSTLDSRANTFLSIYSSGRQVTAFTRSMPDDLAAIIRTTLPGEDDDFDGSVDEELLDLVDNEPGDGIDNDGDSYVDEEARNGIDDDLDGYIDEDCVGDGFADEDIAPPNGMPIVFFTADPPRFDADGRMYPPRPVLWRGICWGTTCSGIASFTDASNIHYKMVPVSRKVLSLEFRYALTQTNTWSLQSPPAPDGRESVGPEVKWDSTRSLVSNFLGTSLFPQLWREFRFYDSERYYASDEWVIPKRVMIVLGMVASERHFATLQETIRPSDGEMFLDITEGLPVFNTPDIAELKQILFIDNEWVNFSAIEGNKVILSQRGAKFTTPTSHYTGALIYFPRIYTMEVLIPAGAMPE